MKEKEVRVDYREHQLILYAEKKDGSYGPVQTGSYISKNYIDDFWLKRKHLEKEYLEKIKKGEMSPVGYYMILEELTVPELASRVKISARRVKKHLDPRHFNKMTVGELERYCEVFNVPVINMFHSIIINKPDVKIIEKKTANPHYTILRIDIEKK